MTGEVYTRWILASNDTLSVSLAIHIDMLEGCMPMLEAALGKYACTYPGTPSTLLLSLVSYTPRDKRQVRHDFALAGRVNWAAWQLVRPTSWSYIHSLLELSALRPNALFAFHSAPFERQPASIPPQSRCPSRRLVRCRRVRSGVASITTPFYPFWYFPLSHPLAIEDRRS